MTKTIAKNKYMVICNDGNKRVNAESYEMEGSTANFYHQGEIYHSIGNVESITEIKD